MPRIKFYFNAFIQITFNQEFKKFEQEYFAKSTHDFFKDKKYFSEKEEIFLAIIGMCYNKNLLKYRNKFR